MAERTWYYAKGPVRHGPVPESVLLDLRARGELAQDDLVWTEGQSGWKAFAEVPELVAAAGTAPVPPPFPGAAPAARGPAPAPEPGTLDVSVALSSTFARLGGGYWPLVLWALVALVVQFLCALPVIGAIGFDVFVDILAGSPPETFDESRLAMMVGGFALSFLLFVLTYGPLEWIQTRLALEVADGRAPEAGGAWSLLGKRLGTVYVTSVVSAMIVLLGLVACILPGLAAGVMLAFVYPILADDAAPGIRSSLDQSWALVSPRFWGVVVLMLLVAIVPAAIGQFCGLLMPFVMPVARVLLVVAYRQLRPAA